jgi:uncharacterized membrane protein YqjE
MELAETTVARGDSADRHGVNGEPSVSSALEHLAAGSQGVITKRIDLALLEGQELLSRTLQRAGLVGAGTLLAVAAWFAWTVCLVQFVVPDASLVVRLALFALLNGGGAVGLVTLAMRRGRLQTLGRRNGSMSNTTA